LSTSQSAAVLLGKEKIGFLGQINPQTALNYQINEPVFITQISLSKIFNYLDNFSPKISYQPVSNFPISEKDLSFLVSENINYNEVSREIKNAGGENLREVSLFDVYQNAEMKKKGKKSISFHLIFQSSSKTLESKETEKIINTIIQKIEELFTAKLRE
jgi:phenylalanyl-tRNA synthetase beta chain